ncbi:MAG TPA: alpha/beta hydrolase [Myxococcota bacterium]|nr:alpha/beta hydrolase [Myxococcota bacterium]
MDRRLFGVGVVVGILGVCVAGLFGFERALLFPKPVPPPDLAVRLPAGAQRLWVQGSGGRSEVWWLPPLLPSAGPIPLLVFAHGNGELIDSWVGAFDEPRRWGLGALLVEYPGYGRSSGSPSEASITEAMTGAYDLATALPGVDPRRVVAYGRSLGGGAACALAHRRPVTALVLESTFTSVRSLARRYGLPGFLVLDPFDNLSVVQSYAGSLLIVHGTHDELIPPANAAKLHAVAPRSELVLEPCGHNDCPRPWTAFRAFLVRAGVL